MIRGRAGKLVLLGITRENVDRLKEGKPMRIPGDDPAIGLPGITIAIIYGETLEDIQAELRSHGLIHETTVIDDRREG